jgi:hypothetical protein
LSIRPIEKEVQFGQIIDQALIDERRHLIRMLFQLLVPKREIPGDDIHVLHDPDEVGIARHFLQFAFPTFEILDLFLERLDSLFIDGQGFPAFAASTKAESDSI